MVVIDVMTQRGQPDKSQQGSRRDRGSMHIAEEDIMYITDNWTNYNLFLKFLAWNGLGHEDAITFDLTILTSSNLFAAWIFVGCTKICTSKYVLASGSGLDMWQFILANSLTNIFFPVTADETISQYEKRSIFRISNFQEIYNV